MPKLTAKYIDRLAEMNAGYQYAIHHPMWQAMDIIELQEAVESYLRLEEPFTYRARGIALAIREIIRRRNVKAA